MRDITCLNVMVRGRKLMMQEKGDSYKSEVLEKSLGVEIQGTSERAGLRLAHPLCRQEGILYKCG